MQVKSDSEMAEILERLFKEIDDGDGALTPHSGALTPHSSLSGALTPQELVELEASLGLTITVEVVPFTVTIFSITTFS